MSEDLWSAYDRMGEDFQRHAADSAYNAHYDRPAVLAALGVVSGLHVLDACCGPGLYAKELLSQGAEVTAFDASPAMVALARTQVAGRARVDRAVLGELLPYPGGAFDRIVCALAIHYADDRNAAFADVFRVLRPGGGLVVSTQPDVWHTSDGDQPVRFWREPLSALCSAATNAGFVIETLAEPRPADTMRERYPDDYAKLNSEPGFLVLRLVKS